MLRFHLPPNLAAAIGRNAIPLRVEVDLREPPPAAELPALALLQRWSGAATPPRFIQLSRAQLRELVAALAGQPCFVDGGQTVPWRQGHLLAQDAPEAPAGPPSRSPAAPRASAPRPPAPPPLLLDGSEHFLALTLPGRDHPRYAELAGLLKEHGFTLEPSNRKWWLRDRHKTLTFLAQHLGRWRSAGDVQVTPNFERQTAHLVFAEIATDVRDTGGTFEVAVGLRAPGTNDDTLRAALVSQRGYVEAGNRIVLLDPARLAQLATAQRALAGDPQADVAARRIQRIAPARLAETEAVLEQLSPGFAPPEAWRSRSAALRQLTTLEAAPLPPAFAARLRPYQRLGAAWLWHLHQHELGGILADEMGLGKTLQALALLCALRAGADRPDRASQPCLVVCPASLLENWRREAARFAPELRVFVHHADRRLPRADACREHDLLITSYGTLTRDAGLFSGIDFLAIVADEAQHLKNRRSQNATALRSLHARSRFLLTGTPLENSLDDLRSLFEFILPGYLQAVPAGVRGDERAWFDARLRAQTAPYILRRTKQAVAPELPSRIEQVLWCELTPAQAALYREVQQRSERDLLDLAAGGASEARLRLAALTHLLRLRQICCDPRLVPANGAPGSSAGTAGFTAADSAKLEALQELLAEAVDDGHRVLVFSQFTSLLALLRPELDSQGLAHCYLDGAMPPLARQAEVDRFQGSPDIPIFLLSLKAGGTGLNLTGADLVVHFDPWWNPAAEAQATDRAHRIGQTRVVTSYKLIAAGTVEEKVLALQAEKRALLAEVFEASDAASARLSLADLRSLLG